MATAEAPRSVCGQADACRGPKCRGSPSGSRVLRALALALPFVLRFPLASGRGRGRGRGDGGRGRRGGSDLGCRLSRGSLFSRCFVGCRLVSRCFAAFRAASAACCAARSARTASIDDLMLWWRLKDTSPLAATASSRVSSSSRCFREPAGSLAAAASLTARTWDCSCLAAPRPSSGAGEPQPANAPAGQQSGEESCGHPVPGPGRGLARRFANRLMVPRPSADPSDDRRAVPVTVG